ncbi:hypothetical protein G9G63_10260 [Paenibacillus sp. EKM202P]|uniref:YopX family protein n=1 Tax=unclassified Paenibacillus TaxID=185978 RepID=UPI0013EA4265|nr:MULTISPECIES: YopX family protein [unclassified Paenibacillus]KAF6564516.1 hypothetical protein G9G63_10260 [Paenibacillus sp. EKM202P]KAF6571669.1 hypothetical protein G9G64_06515 [Paenibacillus sp. EKM207P]
MSRPIKFRAWDVFVKEMDYEVTIDPEGKVAAFNPLDGQYVRGFSDDEKVIMQYTGLKDRNGKEIYEGDVIPPDYALRQNEVAIICYDSNQARFKAVPLSLYKANAGNGGWTGFEVTRHCSIIGNIYENPSLLEDTP